MLHIAGGHLFIGSHTILNFYEVTLGLPELHGAELTRWVEMTEGLSFAALAELVISVACLGNSLEDTVEVLRMLDDQRPSSREFERPGAMGFGALRNQAGSQRRRAADEDDIPF